MADNIPVESLQPPIPTETTEFMPDQELLEKLDSLKKQRREMTPQQQLEWKFLIKELYEDSISEESVTPKSVPEMTVAPAASAPIETPAPVEPPVSSEPISPPEPLVAPAETPVPETPATPDMILNGVAIPIPMPENAKPPEQLNNSVVIDIKENVLGGNTITKADLSNLFPVEIAKSLPNNLFNFIIKDGAPKIRLADMSLNASIYGARLTQEPYSIVVGDKIMIGNEPNITTLEFQTSSSPEGNFKLVNVTEAKQVA